MLRANLPGFEPEDVEVQVRGRIVTVSAEHTDEIPKRQGRRFCELLQDGQQKDRAAVLAAGYDEHLVKPVNPDELARILNRSRKPK